MYYMNQRDIYLLIYSFIYIYEKTQKLLVNVVGSNILIIYLILSFGTC